MTRTNIQVERLIVHGHQTFYPNNTYKVDTDVAEEFVNEGYAIIVDDEPETEVEAIEDSAIEDTQVVVANTDVAEPETEVEKKKRQRKGDK